MTDKTVTETPDSKKGGCKRFAIIGAITMTVMFIAIPALVYIYLTVDFSTPESPKFIKDASLALEEKAAELLVQEAEVKHDPDQTVMALYSIEKAIAQAKSFEDLTEFVLQDDAEFVAPEVQELKIKFFNAYKDLLHAEDEIEDQEAILNVATKTILSAASMFEFDVGLSNLGTPTFSLGNDKEQAKEVWDQYLEDEDLNRKLKQRLNGQHKEIMGFLFEYQDTSAKYYREWDKLCSLRDRAYLALHQKNFEEAKKNAAEAIVLAPNEKEAHILLAICLMEEETPEFGRSTAELLVDDFLEKHQGQQAPAHLLNGIINTRNSDYKMAAVDFDQAAAYYPKQEEVLHDQLNLYTKRAYLNNSLEGRVIINMYREMMSGSGYFSPEFQKANLHIDQLQKDQAKEKIFDHFFRRRKQGEWDRILSDYEYAKDFLEDEELAFNPETELNLKIDSTFFSNGVSVNVANENSEDIHNVTILLCVRFTEMFPGDYVSFPVGDTQALLPANSEIEFGKHDLKEVTLKSLNKEKKFEDIVEYAAVLISDEIITWVEPQHVEKAPSLTSEISKTTSEWKDVTADLLSTTVDSVSEKTKGALESVSKVEVDAFVDKAISTIKDTIRTSRRIINPAELRRLLSSQLD